MRAGAHVASIAGTMIETSEQKRTNERAHDDYVLGRSAEEYVRLRAQARV